MTNDDIDAALAKAMFTAEEFADAVLILKQVGVVIKGKRKND